jgi:ketosteroid isomerase-like protein
MSRENVEAFKRWVEAWNRDDLDAWIDELDPEVQWFTLVEVYRGHAEAVQAWESLKTTQRPKVRIDDLRDLDESVLSLGEIMTVGQRTELSFSGEFAQLVRFRHGKVADLRDFSSHAEALEAARLSE